MENKTIYRETGYFKYRSATEERTQHKGFSYKTSASLVGNIIAKKEQRDLFSEIDSEGKLAVTETSKEYTDRKGKRVNLSPIQAKVVTALAQVVDTLLDKDGVKEYVKSLPSKIEDRQIGADGRRAKLPNSVRAVIDIPELTKLVYSAQRIGGKQTDKVRQEIMKLSEIIQVWKFKDDRGGTLTIEAPLIQIGKRIKYETESGITKLNKVEIYFEDVFVYEINDRYSLSPITLLQQWNGTGVQTELFTMLLFLLQNVSGNYIKHSKKSVADKRKELLKEKRSAQEIEQELKALRKRTLTYKESITSLLERLGTDKYKDRGKYIRINVLNKDLKQATDALIKMGIITGYFESVGISGDKVCNFVINDRWLTDEANKIKALLPPDEIKQIESGEGTEPDEGK